MVYNICNRFHKTWSTIEMDDLIQYCRLSIMKLYNKGLYLHPNLIARTFYNDMMMVLRKDPVRIDIDSLDEIAFDNSDDKDSKIIQEREKLVNKIKQLETDLHAWENNIGFFSKSSNSDSLVKEFSNKIESARHKLALMQEKLRLIDGMI